MTWARPDKNKLHLGPAKDTASCKSDIFSTNTYKLSTNALIIKLWVYKLLYSIIYTDSQLKPLAYTESLKTYPACELRYSAVYFVWARWVPSEGQEVFFRWYCGAYRRGFMAYRGLNRARSTSRDYYLHLLPLLTCPQEGLRGGRRVEGMESYLPRTFAFESSCIRVFSFKLNTLATKSGRSSGDLTPLWIAGKGCKEVGTAEIRRECNGVLIQLLYVP